MILKRRGFLGGLLFAPAIIRTPGLLMPVKATPADVGRMRWVRFGMLTPEEVREAMRRFDNTNHFLPLHISRAAP